MLALALGVRAAGSGGAEAYRPAFDNIMLERATSVERIGNTLGPRLRNWRSGLLAFAERPVLGWGTGNYFAGSARHVSAREQGNQVNDHAHNLPIEEAATKGGAGLAAYFLLWGFTGAAVLRRVRTAGPREQALAIFAGAALAGWFVQSQTLFYSPSTWLQHMLLLAFAIHLDAVERESDDGAGMPARWGAPFATLRQLAARTTLSAQASRAVRTALAMGAVALAGRIARHKPRRLHRRGGDLRGGVFRGVSGQSRTLHARLRAARQRPAGHSLQQRDGQLGGAGGQSPGRSRAAAAVVPRRGRRGARGRTAELGDPPRPGAAVPPVRHHGCEVRGARASPLRAFAGTGAQPGSAGTSAGEPAMSGVAGPVRARFFQIGFRRCGTTALAAFFNRCAIPCVHHDRGRLARRMRENLAAARAPLDGYDRRYAAFTNIDFQTPTDHFDGFRHFEALLAEYGGRFILNTRPVEHWLRSIMRNAGHPRRRAAYRARFGTDDLREVAACWRTAWEEHHRRVIEEVPAQSLLGVRYRIGPAGAALRLHRRGA